MPDPIAPITGKGGSILIGTVATLGPPPTSSDAAAICGKLLEWSLTIKAETVESKGGGVDWDLLAALGNDWEFRARVEFEDTAAFNMNDSLLGLGTFIAAKRSDLASEQAVVLLAGALSELEAESPSDEAITGSITVICSTGLAPTIRAPHI